VPIIDERTGAVSREWYRWFYNLYTITGEGLGVTPVINGGTGLSTIPTNGQLLIGNGTGYDLNTLATGSGISVTNGVGAITLANTGVLSFAGGATGLSPTTATTGAVTLGGILNISNGGTFSVANPTAGAVAYGDGSAYKFTAVGTAGQLLTSAGAAVPTWSNIADIAVTSLSFGTTGLTPSTATKGAITVAGTLAVANGGTGLTSTPANGALDIGNGTGFTRATLTAGSGVSITNGAGSISISATGLGGDVVGPASATDEAIARYDGTTGKLIQNSSATLNDSGQLTLGTGSAFSTNLLTIRADAGAAVVPAISLDGYGSTTYNFGFRRAGGTIASPTATLATSVISILGATTGDGTTYANTTAIQSLLETLATPTSQPTAITFAVTPSGSITRGEVLRLRSTGAVAFSGATNYGSSGQVLQSNGNAAPTWTNTPTLTGTNFSAIPNSALSNSTISGVALGGSLFNLTAGTGVSFSAGTTYNGSTAITINATGTGGTVTSVSFTGGIISVATATTTPALTVAGTSGGIPYFSSGTTWASSAALAANAIVLGGGAGAAPATTTTGTGVVTALGVNTGTAGAFVVNGDALGTPSSGTVTNLTGTASININGTVGATTANTGAFTTLSATGVTTVQAGTALLPAITTTGDTNTGIFFPAADTIAFSEGGAESMRINSSGNVGIGVSPSQRLQVRGGRVRFDGNTENFVLQLNNSTTANGPFLGSAGADIFVVSASSGSERMRIDAAGIVTLPAYGAGAATFSATGVISSVSDETWKIKDGVPTNPDAMLKKLEPGYWYYNDEKKETFGADRQLGFYAQNVNAAIGPEAAPIPEEGKPWGYYDRSVLAITVMSLQKALLTIESLTDRITALEQA
jgi:hypothetical protein